MSNIKKYEYLQPSSMDDLSRMSKAMAASGLFRDVKDAAQAMVKIQAGAELGISPFQAMSGVHIISGKPVIGAGLMAAMIDAHPDYDFEVLEQNDRVCSVKFFKNGKVRGTSTFTIEDAKRAGTQNIGKFPANMLYARAMSNGAKWYCPGVFSGPVYVPEEMEEVTEDVQHVEVNPEPKAKVKPAAAPAKETRVEYDPDFLHKTDLDEGQPAPWEEESKWPPIHGEAPIKTETKKELLQLASHVTITLEEKRRVIGEINDFTEVEARQQIDWLKNLIRQRVNAAPQQRPLPPGYKAPKGASQINDQRNILQELCKSAEKVGLISAEEKEKTLALFEQKPDEKKGTYIINVQQRLKALKEKRQESKQQQTIPN